MTYPTQSLKIKFSIILSVCTCLLINNAFAQTSGDTLEKIKRTRILTIGVRDNTLPFSTLSQGMATGYTVDLCNKVFDATRKELKLPDLKVRYIPVTGGNRIEKLTSGEIDMECGTTVNTRSRQTQVAFSYSIFFAGERLLVRNNSGISELENLNGKNIAVIRGSTAEKMFTQIRVGSLRNMNIITVESNADAWKALDSGKVVAIGQLDILLESMLVQSKNPETYTITQKALSVEPMAIMVRKEDKAFLAIVDKTIAAIYSSGEINAIYDRWFNNGPYQIPTSRMLREAISHPNHESAVALGLGFEL